MRRVTIGLALSAALLGGCITDAATRLAYDLEAAAGKVGPAEGDRYTLVHRTPSRFYECTGPYTVQLDKVGALIFWCMDDAGKTVASPRTSYHRRFVVTPQTWILDKPAGEALVIELRRRDGRVIIESAR